MLGKIKLKNTELTLETEKYKSNGALAIVAKLPGGEVYCMVSSNTKEGVAEDCFALKCWAENEEIAQIVLASGIFEDTGLRIKMGYVESIPILKLKKKFGYLVMREGGLGPVFKSLQDAEKWRMQQGSGGRMSIHEVEMM